MVLHPGLSGDPGARLPGTAQLSRVAVTEPGELSALRVEFRRRESMHGPELLRLAVYGHSRVPGHSTAENNGSRADVAGASARAARADRSPAGNRAARRREPVARAADRRADNASHMRAAGLVGRW